MRFCRGLDEVMAQTRKGFRDWSNEKEELERASRANPNATGLYINVKYTPKVDLGGRGESSIIMAGPLGASAIGPTKDAKGLIYRSRLSASKGDFEKFRDVVAECLSSRRIEGSPVAGGGKWSSTLYWKVVEEGPLGSVKGYISVSLEQLGMEIAVW